MLRWNIFNLTKPQGNKYLLAEEVRKFWFAHYYAAKRKLDLGKSLKMLTKLWEIVRVVNNLFQCLDFFCHQGR